MEQALIELVWQRAHALCEYCRLPQAYSVLTFEIDHIIAKKHGGATVSENLCLACFYCNNHKYNKTHGRDPVTEESAPLFHPRKQRWRDHFAWGENYTLILGLTPTGRATVETLRLNREGLVNLRRVLYAVGEHPPADPKHSD